MTIYSSSPKLACRESRVEFVESPVGSDGFDMICLRDDGHGHGHAPKDMAITRLSRAPLTATTGDRPGAPWQYHLRSFEMVL